MMETTVSHTNGHVNGYPHGVDLEDTMVLAKVVKQHALKMLPGGSLADEMVRALLEENASLRKQVSSKPKMTQGVVEQLGRENAELRIENAELRKTKYDVADLMQECHTIEAELHEDTRDEKAVLKFELREAKAKIALLERQLRGAERIIEDQAVRNGSSIWE